MIRLAGHPAQSQIFDTKARAAAWGHATEAALRDQARGTVRATLQDAIDKYIKDVCPTHRGGDNEAKRLRALSRAHLPCTKDMRMIYPADVTKFRDQRLEEVSIATVRKEMGILRSVFESARRDWGMIDVNPFGDVKRPPAPPARKRLMADGERDQILRALGYADDAPVTTLQHQVAIAMLLALQTGMRAGEIIGLEWGRVHLAQQFLTLPMTKNGDQRDVPLSRAAVALLGKMAGIDKTAVFTVTSASLDALFRKARDACKIEGLHFHDTRANAITALAAKLDIHDLARMIGHRDLKSLLTYYRKSASSIAQSLG